MATSDSEQEPQAIVAPLTSAAIFLTLTIGPDGEAAVRDFCGGLSGLLRTVGSRDAEARLSCVMGIGSAAWDRLFSAPRPAELHPFREFRAGERHAMATPGDLLFHFRANRMDMCFELATLVMDGLGPAVATVDEVQGFRYFDARDLVGFVDGTENPQGDDATAATLIGAEDAAFAAGSYVITQKYLHDMAGWNALPTEAQERIIGRTKAANIELAEGVKPTWAHSALTVIVEEGQQQAILRDNMPFGHPGQGEFGTFFIGYCRTPRITEKMLENMFVGRPPGNYDRLLDFSRPVTGGLFFCPSASFLDDVPASPATAVATRPAAPAPAQPEALTGGSLGIGSLKGEPRHE